MSAFSIDDVVLDLSEKDYKPARRTPKEGAYYEFIVKSTTVKQGKAGHLNARITLEARDSEDSPMFKQWLNLPLPVSFGDVSAPEHARWIFLVSIKAFFPEHLAYDYRAQDTATKKWIYFKDGKEVNGSDLDEAITNQNRINGKVALEMAHAFIESQDQEAPYDRLNGKRVWGRLDRNGDYLNVRDVRAKMPEDQKVIYSREEAFA